MAVIIEKTPALLYRSATFPTTEEEKFQARKLDSYLIEEIPRIEQELVDLYGLSADIPKGDESQRGGNVKIWYELGRRLGTLADDPALIKPAERLWLWKAIRTLYATGRILRKDRGPTRLHLEYCYRLSKLPWKFVEKFHWDDWVCLLDSKSLRADPRSDRWIQHRIGALGKLSRSGLRRLVRELNKRLKNKDTSVFSQAELFALYEEVLDSILPPKK